MPISLDAEGQRTLIQLSQCRPLSVYKGEALTSRHHKVIGVDLLARLPGCSARSAILSGRGSILGELHVAHIVRLKNSKKSAIHQCQPTNAEIIIVVLIQGLISHFTRMTKFICNTSRRFSCHCL